MFEISSTEIAVLGLLYEHHHYANRIEEIINKRSMPQWADIEYSSMEDALKKLLNNGLIKREKRDEYPKYVYSITKNGRKILLDETKKLMSTSEKMIFPLTLQLQICTF